jgi:hypothetical protein
MALSGASRRIVSLKRKIEPQMDATERSEMDEHLISDNESNER